MFVTPQPVTREERIKLLHEEIDALDGRLHTNELERVELQRMRRDRKAELRELTYPQRRT